VSKSSCAAAFLIFASCSLSVVAMGQFRNGERREALGYAKAHPNDPIAHLQQRIDSGEVTLTFDETRGYLPSVLKALDIPLASQGLVFSRTSLQVDRIAPWNPRALYFKDDVYVGWVPGGPILEIGSVDPKLGGVFYTLHQEATAKPTFERDDRTCLQCHDSIAATGGVPGFIMRSVVADRYGYPVMVDGDATNDTTPLGRRWGGWYVTGNLGSLEHMGNLMLPALTSEIGNVQQYLAKMPLSSTGGAADLSAKFDTSIYLTPHSDAIALLVLAHQTSVHNLITLARYESLKAAAVQAPGAPMTLALRGVVDRLLRGMLFSRQSAYPGRVSGTANFEQAFVKEGPRDSKGRSLRDFDLEHRLFRYPFSFLVYSESFDELPADVKQYFSQRLRQILSGEDQSEDFAYLTAADRQAIREILHDTKPGLID